MTLRHFWLLIHRWGGLILAVPLIIVGLTGSIIAFDKEMKHLLTPERYATPRPGVPPLDLETLAARAQVLVPPEGSIVSLARNPEYVSAVIMPRMDMAAIMAKMEKRSFSLTMLFSSDFTQELPKRFPPFQLFLDPWTGKELGREMVGGGLFASGVMRFIHQLHDNLALGIFGNTLLGIIALLWTLDCFVSYYLTFPVSRRREAGGGQPAKSWWARWKPAWKIKAGASAYRFNFDLHRANGLWLWPMLFIFAWSSVQFNLRSVYESVTATFFEYQSPRGQADKQMRQELEKYRTRDELPATFVTLASARRLAAQEATRLGIPLGEAQFFTQMSGSSVAILALQVNQPDCRDIHDRPCVVAMKFDSKSGAVLEFKLPDPNELRNEATGNFITRWLRILHKGQTLGLWYQIFVSALGIIIATLSVTGVYIWWKKRKARKHSVAKKAEAALAADVTT